MKMSDQDPMPDWVLKIGGGHGNSFSLEDATARNGMTQHNFFVNGTSGIMKEQLDAPIHLESKEISQDDPLMEDLKTLAKRYHENGHDEIASVLRTVHGILVLRPNYKDSRAFLMIHETCAQICLEIIKHKDV